MNLDLILAISASIVLAVGVIQWQKADALNLKGIKTTAIIYKNIYRQSDSDSGYYYPVIRFVTEKKVWITHEFHIGFIPKKPEGSKLNIVYDPEEPTVVEINSTFFLIILPRLLVILGITGFVYGLMAYLEYV